MSNFFVLENGPVASPGRCGICGYSGSERKFTDPRKDFEFYGSFIICETCVMSMAEDYGYLEPSRVAALIKRNQEVEKELEQLLDLRDTLGIVYDALSRFNRDDSEPDVSDVSDLVSDSPELVEEPTLSLDSDAEWSSDEEGRGDSEIDVDLSVERPDDVLHLAARLNAGELDV